MAGVRECGCCVYWARIEDKSVGHCRFNPPIVVPAANWINEDRWPLTSTDEWCGKFDKGKRNPPLPKQAPLKKQSK